jgi:DNA-3-methyladenine glycosylase
MPDAHSDIRPLNRAFFARDPRRVARELLGKILVRNQDSHGARRTARIVEVEAYLGENDPASHSAVGRTLRNAVLFGPPGHAYVYFIYGTHYCLNVSCEPDGIAGGVLFRALEPLTGLQEMAVARDVEIPDLAHAPTKSLIQLTSGPGRLAEAFSVTRTRDNACDLTSSASSLWLGERIEKQVREKIGEDAGKKPGKKRGKAPAIRATPRIGITKAADMPLRYILDGNPFVSKPINGGSGHTPRPSRAAAKPPKTRNTDR